MPPLPCTATPLNANITRRTLLSAVAMAPVFLILNRISSAMPIVNNLSKENSSIRIALITDTHTTRGTNEDQALYKPRFDAITQAVNAEKVDFVLHGGDLTQSAKAEEFSDFRTQAAGLTAPLLGFVAGNHDVGAKKSAEKPGGVSGERVAHYEAEMGESFWVREAAGIRVVGINASLLGSGLQRENDQWDFLDKTLGNNASKSIKAPVATILLTHYPLFLKTADEPSEPYWNTDPEPRARLLELIKRGGVQGVLSGHIHQPLVNEYEGVKFITAPPVSFGLPRGKQPQGWTLITISPHGVITYANRSIEQ